MRQFREMMSLHSLSVPFSSLNVVLNKNLEVKNL